jgi:thiamine-phosphate pyrophosphorylase
MPTQPSRIPAQRESSAYRRTLERLSAARLYLCTDRRADAGDLAAFSRAAFDGGVDIVQVRDKQAEAADELAALAVVAREAPTAGGLVAANDRADVALLAGVDVFHVGQHDLTPAQVRRIAPDVVIGLSTHDPRQIAAAIANPDVDYFCVGPVWSTPTKPGRPGVGLDLVRRAVESGTDKPWFAIGGIDHRTVGDVVAAGATRIVVVRAITGAADPAAAARALRDHLPGADV